MLMNLIIELIAGAVGGHVAGGVMKNENLTMLLKTLVGAIGGVGGGKLLGVLLGGGAAAVDGAAPGMDVSGIIAQIAGGGVGGAILTAIAGMLMKNKA